MSHKESKWDWHRILRLVIAGFLLLGAGFLLVIGDANFLRTHTLLREVFKVFAVALIGISVIQFYYETGLTQKYFDERFSNSLRNAVALNEDYLSKLDGSSLSGILDNVMSIMSGKEREHPDYGLNELVRTEIIPILGKPYRKDYKIRIGQKNIRKDDIKYIQLEAVTTFKLINPTKDKTVTPLKIWAAYDRLLHFPIDRLYRLNELKIGGKQKRVLVKNKKHLHKPKQQEYEVEEIPIILNPGDEVEIEISECTILEDGAMDTFHPFSPIKDFTLEIYPEEDCIPDVDFFTFKDIGPPKPLVNKGQMWEYNGWMLPEQGYCVHYISKKKHSDNEGKLPNI